MIMVIRPVVKKDDIILSEKDWNSVIKIQDVVSSGMSDCAMSCVASNNSLYLFCNVI